MTIATGAYSVERLAHEIQKKIIGYTDVTLSLPVTLWLHIASERNGITNISQPNISDEQIKLIKKDWLYQQIQETYLEFYHLHSPFNNESEYLYLYLFLVSMGIFDLTDNWAQKMLRGKWALNDLVADINKRTFKTLATCFPSLSEHTMFYDHIKYQLLQTHLQLLLFNGFTTYFDKQTFEQKKIKYIDAYVDRLAEELLAQTFDTIDKEVSNEVWQLTYYRYQSIVYELVLEEQRPLLVGLDFRLNYTLKTNIIQRLTRFLDVNVELTKVKSGGTYDLVITNYQPKNMNYESSYVYRISEFETEYDRKRIIKILEQASLKRQNKPIV